MKHNRGKQGLETKQTRMITMNRNRSITILKKGIYVGSKAVLLLWFISVTCYVMSVCIWSLAIWSAEYPVLFCFVI